LLNQKIVKSVLNKHKKRDNWFLDDYSVNPYEGCSVNCLYCYIRGSKYGENMAEHLSVKANITNVLEKQLQLRARKNQYGFVAVGSATDAYMHQEEQLKITEKILNLLLKYRFPVFISTKRSLITRDIDLLKAIDKAAILPEDLQRKLHIFLILSIYISTMDETISNGLEPGALLPLERLQLLQQLKQEDFLVGVNAIPVLPFISDTDEELEKIISAAKHHQADYVLVGGLTLFGNEKADSKTLYYKFLNRYQPQLIKRYDELYSGNFYAPFQYQNNLKQRADMLCGKYNIRSSILE
jgi:DNA repair photolyase